MGFFSKLTKGIGKIFKKIGRGIKKVAMKVGKAIGKLGIVGQIALMFILPGIGGMLAKGFGALTAGALASSSAFIQGIGHVLATAGKFASTIGNAFSTVTKGITGFIKSVGGKVLEKVGLKVATDGTLTEAFSQWMNDTVTSFGDILDPWKMSDVDYISSIQGKLAATSEKASKIAENVSVVETDAAKASKEAIDITFTDESLKTISPDVIRRANLETMQTYHDDFVASASSNSESWVKGFRDSVTEAPQKFMDAIKQTVVELPGQIINEKISNLLSPPEDFDISTQINPVVSYVQQVDMVQQQFAPYGSSMLMGASFLDIMQGGDTYGNYLRNFGGVT